MSEKILTRNLGKEPSLEVYEAGGGYQALRQTLQSMTPGELIELGHGFQDGPVDGHRLLFRVVRIERGREVELAVFVLPQQVAGCDLFICECTLHRAGLNSMSAIRSSIAAGRWPSDPSRHAASKHITTRHRALTG